MEISKELLEYANSLSFRELAYYNRKYGYIFVVNDGNIIDFYKEAKK
ncbi:MAG: hypothetical protein LBF33_00110 [Oscillospiraceae bacterium]|jgi:hypothetical protein|nr:hypothetical protein [Oscillospiraceae bacterium]